MKSFSEINSKPKNFWSNFRVILGEYNQIGGNVQIFKSAPSSQCYK